MSSSWLKQATAIFRKEWRSEMRSKHGLLVGGLFSLLIAVVLGMGAAASKPDPKLTAGMITAGMLFAAATIIPRVFLIEEDQGTLDLLRCLAEPSSTFVGKALYASLQMLAASVVLVIVFLEMSAIDVVRPWLLWGGVFGSSLALGFGMSFCGSVVLGAANRWLLAGVIGLPLVLPTSVLSTVVLEGGLGGGLPSSGAKGMIGLVGLVLLMVAMGVGVSPFLWGLTSRRDNRPKSKGRDR
jgi:heme exporter protein B